MILWPEGVSANTAQSSTQNKTKKTDKKTSKKIQNFVERLKTGLGSFQTSSGWFSNFSPRRRESQNPIKQFQKDLKLGGGFKIPTKNKFNQSKSKNCPTLVFKPAWAVYTDQRKSLQEKFEINSNELRKIWIFAERFPRMLMSYF